MKSVFTRMILLMTLVLTGAVWAQGGSGKSDMSGMKHQQKEGMMQGMDHEKMMEHMKKMQEHRLKMHDLSNKILAETDSAKQQALKDEQLQLMMQHHMAMRKHHKMMGMEHGQHKKNPAKAD